MPQPWFANSSSSITAWCTAAAQPGIVTFTWTKPVKTQEIVLPSALTYIIYVIQCLRQTERSSGTWQGDYSPHPHMKTSLQTRLKWPQVCTCQVCSHTHMQKLFRPHLSAVRTLSNTYTGAWLLHLCSVQPPHPAQSSPPLGLVRANPAVDSAAPIAAPPPVRVVREMKALGVHYKTTRAAAGDRPPGATSYPFSSLHPHLFPSCPSISKPCSTFLSVTHSAVLLFILQLFNTWHSWWIKLNIDLDYYNMMS